MYLKSLTLKGFKSFADRAHMSFEPGLTVIVGPNGSGKSNISDAILWVLGEQSAKQLRGQAMEDVIFSGSSARKPVGVAEVTLVLDNSDHMLPVDFNEVAVTRRMYRSGESEYLINSSPCRLMDIQDILHDSGLGKDTHSIISQGKLDAILQSRPEERRALIEEAAGISKHKRRKERALKKIASMDEHLKRARDINREITRQLRPLERQVDRARKYRDLTDRANELTQILAVDELRRLQASWGDMESSSREADAAFELANYRLGEKQRELEKLQVMLEEKGLFVGDLGEQRRHMQDVVGRIGSDMRLLEEKGRNMVSRLSEMRGTLSSSEHQRKRVADELEQISAQLDEVRAAAHIAREDVDEAAPAAEKLHARRKELDVSITALTRDQRDAQRAADAAALEYVKVKETISNAELEDSMYASRLDQLDEQMENLAASLENRRSRAEELDAELTSTAQRREDAKGAIDLAQRALEGLRARETEARQHLSEVRSELASLKKLDERAKGASPLTSTIANSHAGDIAARLGDLIEAPEDLESLVESLLSSDIDALVTTDEQTLARLGFFAVEQKDASGEALLLSCDAAGTDPAASAAGFRLVERLSVRDGFACAVASILGGVYVVDSLDEALGAPAIPGVMYVTRDGARVTSGGAVRVGSAGDAADGALERKRRIRTLEGLEPDLSSVFEHAGHQVSEASDALAQARSAEAEVAGDIARIEGEKRSLLSEIGRLEQSYNQSQSERKQVERRRELSASAPIRLLSRSRMQATNSRRYAAKIPRLRASSLMPRFVWHSLPNACAVLKLVNLSSSIGSKGLTAAFAPRVRHRVRLRSCAFVSIRCMTAIKPCLSALLTGLLVCEIRRLSRRPTPRRLRRQSPTRAPKWSVQKVRLMRPRPLRARSRLHEASSRYKSRQPSRPLPPMARQCSRRRFLCLRPTTARPASASLPTLRVRSTIWAR